MFRLLNSWADIPGVRVRQGSRIISTHVVPKRQQCGCWLDLQCLTGIVPKALPNLGPSDGEVSMWPAVPSGKPQAVPPCSYQEEVGAVLSPSCWHFGSLSQAFRHPWDILRFRCWLYGWGFRLLFVLRLLLTGKLEIPGPFC